MPITPKKNQYALRAIFELAKHQGKGPKKISEIAEIQVFQQPPGRAVRVGHFDFFDVLRHAVIVCHFCIEFKFVLGQAGHGVRPAPN